MRKIKEYAFSEASKKKLVSCEGHIQAIFNEVIKHYDCTVLEGHRSNDRQEDLYHKGLSKLKAGKSKHNANPSMAIDVAPYPIDWKDTKRFYHFAGYVKGVAESMGLMLRWGGDWDSDNDLNDQTFMDLVHFEVFYK